MASPGSSTSTSALAPLSSPWPWVGLSLGILLTLSAWLLVLRGERTRLEGLRAVQASEMTTHLDKRMLALGQVLQGAAGYLGRGPLPSRSEWQEYVASLHLGDTYPGLQGLSFVAWIPRAELPAHIQRLRKEGFPDYSVDPGGSLPPDPDGCGSIIYLEPGNARNYRAFGKDMLRDPVRREAMLRARDRGLVTLTGPVRLYQETEADLQVGAVLMAPVYQQALPLVTLAQRRKALRGWTSFPLRMEDLVGAVLARDLRTAHLRLFDGVGKGAAGLLFDSDPGPASAPRPDPIVRTFEVAGRAWTAEVAPNAAFYEDTGQHRHWEVPISGLAASLFLFTVLVLLTGAEARARQLAEQRGGELLATEVKFRALFEKAPFGLAILDTASGRFLSANARLGQILGYAPEALLDLTYQSVTHPEHLASDLASLQQLTTGATDEVHKDRCYLHRDGHEVWGRLSMVRLPVPPGAPPRHLAVLEDTTEERRQDLELRASEERFRAVFNLSPDPVTLIRLSDGSVVMANLAWCEATGIALEEALGHDPASLGAWGIPANREALLAELRREGHVRARESILRNRDGTEHHMLVTAQAINLEGEDLALVTGKDVTERHLAEAALQESEARWQFALDGVGDGVWDWQGDAEHLVLSRGYRSMLGHGEDEGFMLSYQGWLDRIHPEDLASVQEAVSAYLEGHSPTYETEYRLRHKDGHYMCILARGRAVARDGNGRPTRIVGTHSDISERKQTERALQESEARFRTLIDASPVAIFLHREGCFTFLNPAALRLFRATGEVDLLGTPLLNRIHPDDRDLAQLRITQGYTHGYPNALLEQRWLALDGAQVEVEVQSCPVTFGGQTIRMAIAQDISERKKAEAALQAREARLRLIGDQLPDSFLYQYATGRPGEASRFLYVSAGVERLCGVRAEEVLQDAGLLLGQVDPALRPAYQEAEAASARDLSPFAMSLRQRHANGDWRWFRVRSIPRPQPDGSILWDGISTDITDLQTSRDLLEENEARFRGVVDSAGDAVFLNDETGRILLCNPAACASLGYSMEELLRLRIPDIDPGYLETRNTAARQGLRAGQQVSISARHRRKDGTFFPVEVRLSILKEEPRQILAVVRDLSEREQVEQTELRARKAESLVLMAGGIAHDFNNLFQAIQGNLEVAGLRAKGNPIFNESLNRAMGALNRAISLSWKMLDFSGHGFMRMLPMDLEAWLPAYVESLRLEFPPTFQLCLACDPVPSIRGDRSKLEQVVKAVLDNALEAAGPPGSRIQLRLSVDFGADRPGPDSPGIWPLKRPTVPATVCLEIADDGPGVPPERLDLICDPFYTTREPGRGLGLAAGVGILTAHRAGLHILNREGGGLVLRMHFPPSGA